MQNVYANYEFQFHKGTIKPSLSYKLSYKVCCFNSIKVRLNPSVSECMPFGREFQFHKGTIKPKMEIELKYYDAVSIP